MRKLILFIALSFLLGNQFLFSQVPSYVPTIGLVGYWPFSGNANDASTNGNNGTVNGASLTTDRNGVANSAYSFNGNSGISIPHSTSLNIASSSTFSFWLKYNSLSNGFNLVFKKGIVGGCPNSGYYFAYDGIPGPAYKCFGYGVPGNCSGISDSSYLDNQWHNIVVVYNLQNSQIYFDGILQDGDANNNINQPIFNTSEPLVIGYYNGPYSGNSWNGLIDDIGIWNRALTAQEIANLYTSCVSPAAPTGALTQTFCASPAPTVASLTATGTGIQWYAAATGGSALATTTSLVNGTTYYASQTVSACESSSRLAVTITLNDPQITASATTVCIGTPVTLIASTTATVAQNCNLPSNLTNGLVGYWPFCGNANDVSGNANNGTVNGATLTTDRFGNANSAYNFDGVSNYINLTNSLPDLTNFTLSGWFYHTKGSSYSGIFSDATQDGGNDLYFNMNSTSIGLKADKSGSLLNRSPLPEVGVNSNPLISNLILSNSWKFITITINQNETKVYLDGNYLQTINQGGSNVGYHAISPSIGRISDQGYAIQYFQGKLDDFAIHNRALSPAEISQLYTAAPTYVWSTGATTETINPTPTATTTYWCDVTVNGVTCRKSVTINVNSTTPVPTGALTQTFCVTPAPTVASLTATGTGIQWYAAATGGTALATTTALVNGTTYYASQTVSTCESTARLAVTVSLNDPQITASATTVCSGTPVNLSVNYSQSSNTIINIVDQYEYSYNFLNNWMNSLGSWNTGLSPFAFDLSPNPNNILLTANTIWPVASTMYIRKQVNLTNFDINSLTYSVAVDNGFKLYVNGNLVTSQYQGGYTFLWEYQGIIPSSFLNSGNNIIAFELNDDGASNVFASKIEGNFINTISILWSTGATTATINPTPTATTTYWCDVTFNGVTCRKSVTINVNSTTPAPTGTLTQTFCATPAPTVASLTATGTGIQWYATATGGTALATTTTLANGTTYYATQTLNACESTTRLAVTVTLNDPQITASATTVCSGTPVTLSASTTATVAQNCNLPANLQTGLVGYWPFCGNANDVSGNANNGTVNGATLAADRFGNANSAYNFDGVGNYIIVPSNNVFNSNDISVSMWVSSTKLQRQIALIRLTYANASNEHFGIAFNDLNPYGVELAAKYNTLNCLAGQGWQKNEKIQNILDNNFHHVLGTISGNTLKIYIDGNLSQTLVTPYLQTSNCWNGDIQIGRNWSSLTDFFSGKIDDIGIWNRTLSPSEAQQLYTAAPTYLWSTGDTTATINPSPTATTTYWCDVTVNGLTCRKSVTINVNSTPTPTGTATQTFCATPAPTVASLTATGTGIQWYAAATGGTPLATTTALVSGTTYYATQTLNACESTTRLAVIVTLNDPQITASATTVCSGTPVTLSASTTATVAQNCNLPSNLTNGLVGYWPFCGNANDVSGNANNGTVNGATLAADRFGNANSAYSFDGNDYISTQINRGALGNLMTISAFYKFTGIVNINHSAIIGSSNTIGTDFFIGKNNFDTNIGVQDGNYNHQFVVGSNAFDGNWHNIIYTFENNTGKIYLDGILKNTGNFSKCKISDLLNIGTEFEGSGYYFYGPIDDVGFWNRVLSPTEITQLYNSNPATYLWSTGATTATINPSPTATTTYWCDVTVNGVTCRKSITITVNPNTTPTFTQVAPICNGATLVALPTTSNEGITGTWSPALNNTATTTYTFTPTAGQCATTATMTITVNPNSTPTFTQVAPICNGATVAALPTTSTNSFTGTWSPALNNTATTTYTFTPTAGQCATTATMTITVNPNIAPTFTQVAPICNGATVAALPTTSSNTITGTWLPALNNTATTTYTFTPTAGLCATTASMTITVNPLPIAPTGTITQTFCANIYPTLQNIVVTPSNINWYTSLTSTSPLPLTTNLPVGSTTYYASQFDAVTGCISNGRLAVVATVLLEITPTTLTDQTFCSTDIKTLADIKTNGLNIVWYSSASGGTPLLDSYLLTSSQSLYAAIYNATSGCESPIRQMVQITIINCQLVANNLLTLNDNSLNDNLTIENIENFPINQIEIYNRFGELVWKTEYYNNDSNTFKGRANVSSVFQKDSDLPTGTYYFILKYYDSYRRKYTDFKSFLYINNNN